MPAHFTISNKILCVILIAVTLISCGKSNEIEALAQTFASMKDRHKTAEVAAAKHSSVFSYDNNYTLPVHFDGSSKKHDVAEFIEDTATTGLLILQQNSIIFEQYYRGNTPKTQHLSWSIAKSVVSALIGIAVSQGHIDINKTAEHYVPRFVGTAYDGVRVKDLLQMSSGVTFDEVYGDRDSDITRLNQIMYDGGSYETFTTTIGRSTAPGNTFHYASIDTIALAMVLNRATGKPLNEYMSEHLWSKIGTQQNAYWIVDDNGFEMAMGGLNATLRDYARFGQLYLNKGRYNEEQIIPQQWVADSLIADAPHVQASAKDQWGYGYQWWLPYSEEDEFMAVGIYGQYIYVNPKAKMVIVKNSADPDFERSNGIRYDLHLDFFRQIAAQ